MTRLMLLVLLRDVFVCSSGCECELWDTPHGSAATERQQHIRRIVAIIDSELLSHHIKFQSPLSTFQALLLPDKQPTLEMNQVGQVAPPAVSRIIVITLEPDF